MADASQQISSSEPVNIAQFILQWDSLLANYDNRTLSNHHFLSIVSDKMEITPRMASQLDKVCQLSSLTCDGEPKGIYPGMSTENSWKNIPENIKNLATLKQEMTRRKVPSYRVRGIKRLKYKMMDVPWLHEIKNRLRRDEELPVPNDVVISVQVFMPYFPGRNRPLLLSQEIQVLGQQNLTVLRDKIQCTLDTQILGEFSAEPDLPKDNYAKDIYPSGFFFIEDCFYNDMRSVSSRNLGATIVEWAESDSRTGLGPYNCMKMEETTFDQLTIKLGHPYLYLHQANCEHILIFSDVRVVHPEDCLDIAEYPLVIRKYKPAPQRCKVCIHNPAAWITRNSPLAPEDPCAFCDTCYRMLHYNEEGEKLGEFTAYPCPSN